MTTRLSALVGNRTYNLNDGTRYLWMEDDGLGMVPLHRLVERGPQQHGETDKGFRLDQRMIKLVIGVMGTDDRNYWDVRDALLRIFKPSDTPVSLRWDLPNGAIRQIDVHISSDLSFPSNDRYRIYHKTGVLLRASDPTFYDPTGVSFTFGIGGAAAGFAVPMIVPMRVGSTSLSQVKTMTYAGSWQALPFIRIKGPITNPIVTNNTTGETLNFTGTTIASGDYYQIDCAYNQKTVVDAAGVNQLAKLTDASDLDTFHIDPDPDAVDGANDIYVTGTAISSVTEVYFQYTDRFVGM